ncbi:MAG TPA: DUF924 family protein [Beijerinckiaceae bacterium]
MDSHPEGRPAERYATPEEVIAFWRDAGPDKWFSKDEAFDAACRERFLVTHEAAAAGDLNEWELSAEGALALCLLLDQFPRNMFRGTRRAWRTDPVAVDVADRAIERGHDKAVDPALRRFFYLPFMHAEDSSDQERSVALCEAMGDPDTAKWARHHRDIVARFGRFPHRNTVLGRESTPEEAAFLAEEGAFRG